MLMMVPAARGGSARNEEWLPDVGQFKMPVWLQHSNS